MQTTLSLVLTVLSAVEVFGQSSEVKVHLVKATGNWLDVNGPIKAGADLNLRTNLRINDAKAGDAATLEFTAPTAQTCAYEIQCDGKVCAKPMSVQAIYLKLKGDCHPGGTLWSAVRAAFDRLTAGAAANDLALALTLSRGADENDSPDPKLQEAVLLVAEGRVDASALFRTPVTGNYWLEFCEAGPQLSSECSSTEEQDRTAIQLNAGKAEPIAFSKPDGIYRARLWKMTPRGPQATERSAVLLAGKREKFASAQKAFAALDPSIPEMGTTDPTLRLMLGAWLADTFRAANP